jgi:beta-xylosidase
MNLSASKPLFISLFVCLLFLLAACGSPPPAAASTATVGVTPTIVPVSPTPVPATAEATATVISGETFQNPVIKENFPDPFILDAGDTFWAYATNASGKNIALASSTDLIHWQMLGDAMPALPKWAKLTGGYVWAPEVMPIGDQFVMYYTARDKTSDKQCVGVAVSDTPEGKFKDTNNAPFVCQSELGGTIDPDPFRDEDGRQYLYFKNDGNCCNMSTNIFAQELAPDGLSLIGEPVQLLENDRAWEGGVVEAPTMFKHDGKYYLFYSANDYGSFKYAVGYATCDTPLGPCQDAPENPILKSDLTNKQALVVGPGHQDVFQLGDQTWMSYHVWEMLQGGFRGERRFMYLDPVEWQDGKPVVEGPSTSPESAPDVP